MLEILIDDIKRTLDDFYRVTKTPISLYDEDMNPIYHATGMPLVCREMRKFSELKNMCYACEHEGDTVCKQTKKAYVYKCHAGFTEAHIPICENDVIIGYILTGGILCRDDMEYVTQRLKDYASNCNLAPDAFANCLYDTQIVDKNYMDSAISLIEMCASYLYLSRIIKKKSSLLAVQLKEYVDNHFTEDISVKSLCDMMYMSKTKLYKLSLNTFGMGCSEYIMKKRIEKAKILLETSDKSIYSVAEESGFKDTNYFTRVFKKIVGVTPSKYRK